MVSVQLTLRPSFGGGGRSCCSSSGLCSSFPENGEYVESSLVVVVGSIGLGDIVSTMHNAHLLRWHLQ